MIDYLAIGVTHLLLVLAALRLLSRGDLDREEAPTPQGPGAPPPAAPGAPPARAGVARLRRLGDKRRA